jgi:hypothetical protein
MGDLLIVVQKGVGGVSGDTRLQAMGVKLQENCRRLSVVSSGRVGTGARSPKPIFLC